MWQRWLLLTAVAFCPLLKLVDACPVTSCFGCGTIHVTCSGAMPPLTAFPEISIADQEMVQILDLSGNMLSVLSSDDLQNYAALEELDISSNTLTSVEPGTFSIAFHLEELRLENNNLREIPDNLFVNTSLNELNLGSNMVENISEALFTGLSTFVEIHLDNNQIQTIPEGVLPTDFTMLDLTNNPLHCDCGLRWLPDFIDALPPTAIFNAGTCESPINLAGMDISTLTESQFACECSPACVNGSCNVSVGQCECDVGFIGDDCSFRCPVGFHGQNCEEVCQCQNGAECNFITGECTCTIGWSGEYCNSSSCHDGIMNHGETDVDCGGNLCPSCGVGDVCAFDADCGNRTVCLGKYTHPSGLSYPFRTNDNLHCVDESVPGEALLQRFKDAFLGRDEALTTTDPLANLFELQTSVQEEIEAQFEIEEPLESVEISDLEREPGDPLYHTCLQWGDSSSEDAVDSDIQRMVDNIHSGKLKGTLIISREKKKALINV